MKLSKDKKNQILGDKDLLSIHQIAKKYNLPIFEIKRIFKAADAKHSSEEKTAPKRISEELFTSVPPKWFYAISISLPIIFLIVLEIFLRITRYGYDFTPWIDKVEGKYVINSNIGKKYFTSGDFNPTTSGDYFNIHKRANTFRVFVLGESSAEGFPFSPMGSFPRYIRRRLELVYPNTPVEVINLGMSGVSSYTFLDLLPDVLDQKPDLILIYAGHNEYYGALGVASMQSFGSSRILINLILYLDKFKTTQLVRNSIHWLSSIFSVQDKKPAGTLMSRMAKDQKIILNSELYYAGLEQFKKNLTDILRLTMEKGVPVIIGRLVSNLKDQKPFISINTAGYKTADEVYEKAKSELKSNNFRRADSLFKLAKDLDALRFRAPEKMNKIIEDLGKEFHAAIVPIDSIFDSASPAGIVGDDLIVDHLHPNVLGYQIMGKAFYDCMEKHGYLPNTEKAVIPFADQDSLTRAHFVFTKLDSLTGNNYIKILKTDWPFVNQRAAISGFQQKDFINLFKPRDFIDSIAMYTIENKVSWIDAHFIAATFYLRKDEIKEYLKYVNVLIYQYPGFRDLDGVIRYFYEKNKINLADYTPKRNGLLALYIGNFDNAIRHLTEAYKSNPKDTAVLYNLSLAYSKKKDLKTALTFINKCLSVNPNYPEANYLNQHILNQLK
ncbi:MAG: GDSL-type esterase/lipase family protein, partial [Ignavibacteria bacterium]